MSLSVGAVSSACASHSSRRVSRESGRGRRVNPAARDERHAFIVGLGVVLCQPGPHSGFHSGRLGSVAVQRRYVHTGVGERGGIAEVGELGSGDGVGGGIPWVEFHPVP